MIVKHIDLSLLKEDLRTAVLDLSQRILKAGGRAWMVGGSVRDLMLGIQVKDVDLEVYGLQPDKLREVVGEAYKFDQCGVSFGVLKIQHLDIDIATPRRESKCGDGHRDFLIGTDPSMSLEEAASRRDFTVNALYYDPIKCQFADPFNGIKDLEHKVLRHVSDKFDEDPLRVLRGMQFIARFDMLPAEETIQKCKKISLGSLPAERLYEEWSKLLVKGDKIGYGLEFLKDTGHLQDFPELARLVGCKQSVLHHKEEDVWEHTKMCLDSFAKNRTRNKHEDLIVGLAVLCHDFGKPLTSLVDYSTEQSISFNYAEASVSETLSFLKRLTNEEQILNDVPLLVKYHMQPQTIAEKQQVSDSAVRRLALCVSRIDRLIRVAAADLEGSIFQDTSASSAARLNLIKLSDVAKRLEVFDSPPKPLLKGRHLISLGYKPSPMFSKILDGAFQAQIDGQFNDEDGAVKWLKQADTGNSWS